MSTIEGRDEKDNGVLVETLLQLHLIWSAKKVCQLQEIKIQGFLMILLKNNER